ncbi:MAG: TraR/DksA C4-type zinc finger protein [Acidobacteria bacterium]|nr:TraR/DksA C4-type zinc finger protein [Acidobacteriota bacterium]
MSTGKKVQLQKYRQHLQKVREEIIAKMQRATSNGREVRISAEPSDSGDLALSSYMKEFLYKLNEVERCRFLEIETALERIREGSYGQCVDCGSPLPIKRLEVLPWASRCTACQEKLEQLQQEEEAERGDQEEAANF